MHITAENAKNDTNLGCEMKLHPYESLQKSIDDMGNNLE